MLGDLFYAMFDDGRYAGIFDLQTFKSKTLFNSEREAANAATKVIKEERSNRSYGRRLLRKG